ncbi:MAG: OmpA family protein [Chitinivibrionales bacterium]|nr:OmpA family protein [Chitinivibrionales bacterium]MBD3358964.1 OmpA family protein [Chitinivibrionales bacterium]
MKARIKKTMVVCMVVAVGLIGGCRKKKTVLEEPQQQPMPRPDTSFSEPSAMSVDTSDDVTFREADIREELARKAEEKLAPVYFEYNSFSISTEASRRLAEAAAFLDEYPRLRILVEGHCDERGSAEYNIGLGENRARVVKDYLVNYGIDPIRIEVTSWGKERLVEAGCTNELCHSKNRRAEFKVLQQ